MKKSYGRSGLATHIGPESCGAAREGGVEALTGEPADRVFSRIRQLLRDADVVGRKRKAPSGAPISRGVPESRAVRDPVDVRNREIPSSPKAADAVGRVGKSKDVRR